MPPESCLYFEWVDIFQGLHRNGLDVKFAHFVLLGAFFSRWERG